MAFGADYKLGKSTKLFGYYANWELDQAGTELTTIALGLEQNF